MLVLSHLLVGILRLGAPARAGVSGSPRLGRELAAGTFVFLSEASAPRGLDLDAIVAGTRRQHAGGVCAVSVPDYSRNGPRASRIIKRSKDNRHPGLCLAYPG